MPLPMPVVYRVDEDGQQIVIPGRRLPQILKLWMTLEGALALHDACMQAIIGMPRDPEAVFSFAFKTLKMRPENEPQMVPVGAGPEALPPQEPAPMVPRLVVNRGESEPLEVDPADPAAPKVVEPGEPG